MTTHIHLPWPEFKEKFLMYVRQRKQKRRSRPVEVSDEEVPPEVEATFDREKD